MEKRLYRSEKNSVIAGVCGGIGEYFGIDPTIVRVIFVVLAIWGGVGIILYIIGMVIIPYEGDKTMSKDKEKIKEKAEEFKENVKAAASDFKADAKEYRSDHRGGQTFGLIILLIGLLFLFHNFFPWFNFRIFWPAVLIIIGLFLIVGGSRRRG